jgi:hypothetical protein
LFLQLKLGLKTFCRAGQTNSHARREQRRSGSAWRQLGDKTVHLPCIVA